MIAKTLSRLGIEVWKDIPKYEGLYQVSNLGNVRSLDRVSSDGRKLNGKTLKGSLYNSGYCVVGLRKNGKTTTNSVHKLVCIAFLNHKPCGMKIVVDHINNDPSNNNLYNLQLITHRQNLSKDKKGISKYTGVSLQSNSNKWRVQIRVNGKIKHLGLFTDEKDAAQAYQNELNKIKL